jgi:flavin-dependent dehydrogenase
VTRRATLRGADRTPLAERADVVICGASFAGLAVARELAGSGADVLVVDRYEIGERATSACAAPTAWLHAMGAERAIRQELDCMAFHTPHGSARFRLPWSWSSFDYRELCRALWEQCGDARFVVGTVRNVAGSNDEGVADGETVYDERVADGETVYNDGIADGERVATDRGPIRAALVVDALGWRRVLGSGPVVQPPGAPISRGLEVHPHDARGTDLDIWIDRDVIRRGYAWSVPAAGERRIGVGSYAPRDHVKAPTVAMAERLGAEAVRYQGNWFPHALRPATEDGVFFVGDSAGHCLPLSGEGIRTAFYFGIACGRELRKVVAGEQDREQALAAYSAFSAGHARTYRLALGLQRLIPDLPPRALTAVLAIMGRERPCRRAFTWYLERAHPRFASAAHRIPPSWTTPSPSTSRASSPASSRTGRPARSSPSPT